MKIDTHNFLGDRFSSISDLNIVYTDWYPFISISTIGHAGWLFNIILNWLCQIIYGSEQKSITCASQKKKIIYISSSRYIYFTHI